MRKKPDPVDIFVGSRVRMRRMMLSMSQEKLGDGLNLTFQQVQKYEKGTNRIGASRLQQIAKILNVTAAFFFEGAPGGTDMSNVDVNDFTQAFLADRRGIELADAFMRISDPEARAAVLAVAMAFASTPAAAKRRAA